MMEVVWCWVYRCVFFRLLLLFFLAVGLNASTIGQFSDTYSDVTLHYGTFQEKGPVGVVVEMNLKEGWHTYYKDSGEFGYGLQVRLSEALSQKPIDALVFWEKPVSFTFLDTMGWGYSGNVCFFLPINSTLKPGTVIDFDLDFLVCESVCVPQSISGVFSIPQNDSIVLSDSLSERWRRASFSHNVSDRFFQWDVKQLLWGMFFAFLGGLLLNLMPCVFPVLSLKILGVVAQKTVSRYQQIRDGVLYALGVHFSFLVLVVILFLLKTVGISVGWGFQMQSPLYVFCLLVILSWVMWHLLDILPLPEWLATIPSKTDGFSVTNAFWTGVLVTAVATPCTAPFMAPAIGVALGWPFILALLVFQSLAFGLSFPFLLISLQPRLIGFLPKPGRWMHRVKQVSALPMAVAILWLIWVLMQQLGAVGGALGALTVMVVGSFFWLLKSQRKVYFWIGIFGLFLLMLGIYVGDRVFHRDFSKSPILQGSKMAFTEERLALFRSENRPVFVDVTASWCLTCQFNERTVLNTKRVQQLFLDNDVVFLVADWTRKDSLIHSFLMKFHRQGVPMYVYYPPNEEPILLPELLSFEIILELFDR